MKTQTRPFNPDVIVDGDGVEWLLLSAALKLMPGCRAGKAVHVNTAHRMIRDGRLKAKYRRVGSRRYWYVRKDQVEGASRLLDYEPVAKCEKRDRATERFTREALKDL